MSAALVAALLLDDLDEDDLPAADHLLDLVVAEEAGGDAALAPLLVAALLGLLVAGAAADGLGRGRVLDHGLDRALALAIPLGRDGIALAHPVHMHGHGLGAGGRRGRAVLAATGFARRRHGRRGLDVGWRGGLGIRGGRRQVGGAGLVEAFAGGGRRRLGMAGGRELGIAFRHDLALGRQVGIVLGRQALGGGLDLALGVVVLLRLAGLGLDQALPVGHGDLVVVGVDLAEGEEAVAVAAVLDEGGLEARLHPHDAGEVDVALQRAAVLGLEVEILNPVPVQHHHPRLFGVGGIDQHALGHGRRNSAPPGARGCRRRQGLVGREGRGSASRSSVLSPVMAAGRPFGVPVVSARRARTPGAAPGRPTAGAGAGARGRAGGRRVSDRAGPLGRCPGTVVALPRRVARAGEGPCPRRRRSGPAARPGTRRGGGPSRASRGDGHPEVAGHVWPYLDGCAALGYRPRPGTLHRRRAAGAPHHTQGGDPGQGAVCAAGHTAAGSGRVRCKGRL